MRAADTSVLVRVIVRDDEAQVASAEAFVKKGVWISQVVLVETTWILTTAYNLGHRQVATAIEMLLNHAEITLQDSEVIATALEHYRRRPSLGFSDCLVLEIARKAGHLPLGTFDKGLGKAEGAQRL